MNHVFLQVENVHRQESLGTLERCSGFGLYPLSLCSFSSHLLWMVLLKLSLLYLVSQLSVLNALAFFLLPSLVLPQTR